MNRAVEIGEITSIKDFSIGSSLTVGFFVGVHVFQHVFVLGKLY